MGQEQWTTVGSYFEGALVGEDAALHAAMSRSREAQLPAINVTAGEGKFLYLTALAVGARRILEIGTLGGYSAIWMARALPADGRLITLEYEPKHAEVAGLNLAQAGVADRVEIRVGKALDSLPKIEAEGCGPFDLVFIDADKENNTEYFQWAMKLSRPGTVIIVDNMVRSGKVVDAQSKDSGVQGTRRMVQWIAAQPTVTATVVQTVGDKGYDGFLYAVVK